MFPWKFLLQDPWQNRTKSGLFKGHVSKKSSRGFEIVSIAARQPCEIHWGSPSSGRGSKAARFKGLQ